MPTPMEISLTPLKPAIRANGKGDLDILLRVKAPATPGATVARTPLSLALVIDRSGSMNGARLAAAKACAADLVNRLHGDDEVNIVIYDTEVDVLLPLMPASQARDQIQRSLASFDAGGSTDLHQGWLVGAKQLAGRTGSNRLCRVILLSDGQANHGITQEDEICTQVRGLAQAGVSTTTVGLGEGFNESLMTAMAVAGQGNALYGERAEDLAEPFDSEIGLLSHLAWRDVRLLVGSATSRWKLRNDYAAVGEHLWSMPSIAEGAEAWAVFTAPMDSVARAQTRSRQGKALHVTVTARDGEGRLHEVKASLSVLPEVDEAQWNALPEDELVARRVTEVRAADLQDEARAAVQRGDWERAEALLKQVEELAQDNEWLQGTVAQMKRLLERRDRVRFGKEVMYASYSMKRRLTEVDEMAEFSESRESVKAAYLRRKVEQGRGL
jgi:Ca-activated chloride channel family protein